MKPLDPPLTALVELHRTLERLGPGDTEFSRRLLARLDLPAHCRVADLGCGAGASALLLAQTLQTRVKAVDCFKTFLNKLAALAQERGMAPLIETVQADMGQLDWPEGSLDLLWSEGAVYTLTFEGALRAWRPLLSKGGIAVISDLSWFRDDIPAALREYWLSAYPTLGNEAENAERARRCGFDVAAIQRLPAKAWWNNYYQPLTSRIEALRPTADAVMRQVIADTETEMALFRQHSDAYGYSFYVLTAT